MADSRRIPRPRSNSFATLALALEATQDATLLLAVENAGRDGSNTSLLNRLGGEAFGSYDAWIHAAMSRALSMVAAFDLDVRLVSYGVSPAQFVSLVRGMAKYSCRAQLPFQAQGCRVKAKFRSTGRFIADTALDRCTR